MKHTVARWTLAVLVAGSPFVPRAAATGTSDFELRITPVPASQSMELSWFGANAVSYQLESSSDLNVWLPASQVVTGSGFMLSVTISTVGKSREFFRVKRQVPADTTTATFDPVTGVLTITGDALDNVVVVSRNAAGAILVNGGGLAIQGGTPTVASTMLIQIFGREGNDRISLDETNGALPRANLFGEGGDDTLIGGSGADVLDGGPGNDTLLGKGGADTLIGGPGLDVLDGGAGNNIVIQD